MPEQAENKLPEGFNGTFYFTNFTDTDFVAMWDSQSYTFPANSTVPLIIPSSSPLQVQEIRKKFARELATLVFYSSDKYKVREASAPAGENKTPAIFTDADMAPFIQRCLEPLPMSQAKIENVEVDNTEKKLKTDSKGKRVTKVLEGNEDLTNGGNVLG